MRFISFQVTSVLLIFLSSINNYLLAFLTAIVTRRHNHKTNVFNLFHHHDKHQTKSKKRTKGTKRFSFNLLASISNTIDDGSVVITPHHLSGISLEKTLYLLNNETLLYSLLQNRSKARKERDYKKADNYLEQLKSIERNYIPFGYKLQLKDLSNYTGTAVSIIRDGTIPLLLSNSSSTVTYLKEKLNINQTVLQLAHAALGLSLTSTSYSTLEIEERLNQLVNQALMRIFETNGSELRGRTAADVAFWFSMSGLKQSQQSLELMNLLQEITMFEIKRFGLDPKSDCQIQHICHMLDRLAISTKLSKGFQELARDCLLVKGASGEELENELNLLARGDYNLATSIRCKMVLWNFSKRQRKQRLFFENAMKHWSELNEVAQKILITEKSTERNETKNWNEIFLNPKRPLVIDIGCGMGVSVLGLSSIQKEESTSHIIDWSNCNYIGIDLSHVAIRFAKGHASRHDTQQRNVHFIHGPALETLDYISKTYLGEIACILIQFPTPYKLDPARRTGNSQLPLTRDSTDFMVSHELLELIFDTLKMSSKANRQKKLFLFQSNCEDVALVIRKCCVDNIGFHVIDIDEDELPSNPYIMEQKATLTQRTLKWLKAQKDNNIFERADGFGWCTNPILPFVGMTETEVACGRKGTPIHRFLLTV